MGKVGGADNYTPTQIPGVTHPTDPETVPPNRPANTPPLNNADGPNAPPQAPPAPNNPGGLGGVGDAQGQNDNAQGGGTGGTGGTLGGGAGGAGITGNFKNTLLPGGNGAQGGNGANGGAMNVNSTKATGGGTAGDLANRLPGPSPQIMAQLPHGGSEPGASTPGTPAWSPGGVATAGGGAAARGSFSVSSNGFRSAPAASSFPTGSASAGATPLRSSFTNTTVNSSTSSSTDDAAKAAKNSAAQRAANHTHTHTNTHTHEGHRAEHAERRRDHDGQRHVGRVFKDTATDKTFLTSPAKVVDGKTVLGIEGELIEGEEIVVGKGWLSTLLDLLGNIRGLGTDAATLSGVAKLKVLLAALGVGTVAMLQKTTGIPGQLLGMLGDMAGKLKTMLFGTQAAAGATAADKAKALLLAAPNDKSATATGAVGKPAGGFFAAIGKGIDSIGKAFAAILGQNKTATGAPDKSAANSATGWKSAMVSRGMAAVGIASGGTAALALAGMVPLGPVGWASVAAGIAATGLWQLLRLLLRDSKTEHAQRVGEEDGEDAQAAGNPALEWHKVRARRHRRDYDEGQHAVEPL